MPVFFYTQNLYLCIFFWDIRFHIPESSNTLIMVILLLKKKCLFHMCCWLVGWMGWYLQNVKSKEYQKKNSTNNEKEYSTNKQPNKYERIFGLSPMMIMVIIFIFKQIENILSFFSFLFIYSKKSSYQFLFDIFFSSFTIIIMTTDTQWCIFLFVCLLFGHPIVWNKQTKQILLFFFSFETWYAFCILRN